MIDAITLLAACAGICGFILGWYCSQTYNDRLDHKAWQAVFNEHWADMIAARKNQLRAGE